MRSLLTPTFSLNHIFTCWNVHCAYSSQLTLCALRLLTRLSCCFRRWPDFLVHLPSLLPPTPTDLHEQQGSIKIPLDSTKENVHFHTSSTPRQEGLVAACVTGRSLAPHFQQGHLHQHLLLQQHANITSLLSRTYVHPSSPLTCPPSLPFTSAGQQARGRKRDTEKKKERDPRRSGLGSAPLPPWTLIIPDI